MDQGAVVIKRGMHGFDVSLEFKTQELEVNNPLAGTLIRK